jgi:hypothetical protein
MGRLAASMWSWLTSKRAHCIRPVIARSSFDDGS